MSHERRAAFEFSPLHGLFLDGTTPLLHAYSPLTYIEMVGKKFPSTGPFARKRERGDKHILPKPGRIKLTQRSIISQLWQKSVNRYFGWIERLWPNGFMPAIHKWENDRCTELKPSAFINNLRHYPTKRLPTLSMALSARCLTVSIHCYRGNMCRGCAGSAH